MTANFVEESVQVGGTKIQLFKGGAGRGTPCSFVTRLF